MVQSTGRVGPGAFLGFFLFAFLNFNHSVQAGDSLIDGKPYRQIEAELATLARQYSDLGTQVTYGQSVLGRNLKVFRISQDFAKPDFPKEGRFTKKEDTLPKKAVYLSGVTHGDEYFQIPELLLRHFLKNWRSLREFRTFLKEGGTLYVVPVLNPDRYDDRKRKNAHLVDLNRDFPIQLLKHAGFQEPETRQLGEYLKGDLEAHHARLVFTLDYHCCGSALLYPWSFPGERIPVEDLRSHIEIGGKMRRIFGQNYQFGDTAEISARSHIGTSKDYFYETYQSLSFTFEGRRGVENGNFSKHALFWEQIFERVNSM